MSDSHETRPSDAPYDDEFSAIVDRNAELGLTDDSLMPDLDGEMQAHRISTMLEALTSQYPAEVHHVFVSEEDANGFIYSLHQVVEAVDVDSSDAVLDVDDIAGLLDDELLTENIIGVEIIIIDADTKAEVSRFASDADESYINRNPFLDAFLTVHDSDDQLSREIKQLLATRAAAEDDSIAAEDADAKLNRAVGHVIDTYHSKTIEAIETGVQEFYEDDGDAEFEFTYAYNCTLGNTSITDFQPGSEFAHVFSFIDAESGVQYSLTLTPHGLVVRSYEYHGGDAGELIPFELETLEPPFNSERLTKPYELLLPLIEELERAAA